MGLELDSIHMEARLPLDKLTKLRQALSDQTKRRQITLKALQKRLGLLNFCCSVVTPGRCFLRRLTDLTRKVNNPNHYITLNKENRKDLKAWEIFTEHFNGRNLLLNGRWTTDQQLHIFTDASGSIGFGAIFHQHWFYGLLRSRIGQSHLKNCFPS